MEEEAHFQTINLYWDHFKGLGFGYELEEEVCANDYNLRSKVLPASRSSPETTPSPQKDTSPTLTPSPPPKANSPTTTLCQLKRASLHH